MKSDNRSLDDLAELMHKAKERPENPQYLTTYALEYVHYREQGLRHKTAMQLMRYNYLGNIKES